MSVNDYGSQPPPLPFPPDAPGTQLAAFVWVVYDDLDAIVDMADQLFPEVSQSVRTTLREAWADVYAERSIIVERVRLLTAGELAPVGLVGRPLDLKLELCWLSRADAVAQLDAAVADADQPPDELPEEPPGVLSRTAAWFGRGYRSVAGRVRRAGDRLARNRLLKPVLKKLSKALSDVDSILGSLTKVLKVAEPLKEIKEAVEKLADRTADALPEPEEPAGGPD
jgi:energy-converting hydrogenase A subunit M